MRYKVIISRPDPSSVIKERFMFQRKYKTLKEAETAIQDMRAKDEYRLYDFEIALDRT